jgi:hypothetical protein
MRFFWIYRFCHFQSLSHIFRLLQCTGSCLCDSNTIITYDKCNHYEDDVLHSLGGSETIVENSSVTIQDD